MVEEFHFDYKTKVIGLVFNATGDFLFVLFIYLNQI